LYAHKFRDPTSGRGNGKATISSKNSLKTKTRIRIRGGGLPGIRKKLENGSKMAGDGKGGRENSCGGDMEKSNQSCCSKGLKIIASIRNADGSETVANRRGGGRISQRL